MRWFSLVHAGSHVSCTTLDSYSLHKYFSYGTFTLCRVTFQLSSPIFTSCYSLGPNPKCISTLGLGSCNFARHYFRNRCFTFFSSRYLDVSVPWVPLITLFYSCYDTNSLQLVRFRIRTSAGHSSYAAYRSFSQLITSFVGA